MTAIVASRPRTSGLVLLVLLALSQQSSIAQQALTASSFEGVWKITKVVRAGVVINNPQPSLAIFSRGYTSLIRDNSVGPRKVAPMPQNPAQLTDAEKVALYEEWAPFGASGGSYEVQGNRLITHNVIAKMAGAMTITEEVTVTFDGPDSFVAVAPPGSANAGRQTAYTRVR